MVFFSQIIEKFRNLVKPGEKSQYHPEAAKRDDQQHVMSEDEKLDEALEESFPASDPPAHISRPYEDKNLQ